MYIIENKQTKKWLTIGGNTTTDATHPGLVTFDNEESATNFLKPFEENIWKIKKIK